MRYTIDKNAKETAYLQLYKLIRRDITDGVYKYGAKLPSKRNLALEAGVSVITVEHTFNILCDEGYIEPKERSGYYVIYKSGELYSSPESEEREISLSQKHHTNEESFPFSVFSRTMRYVLSARAEEILLKSPNLGSPELRKAISSYLLRSKGMNVLPEQIVIGSGAEYLYSLIVQLLGRDVIFGLENPSYEKIHSVYLANGAKCEFLKMGKNGIKSAELEKTKANVLHVTPFNSFPSGITATASKRMEYIKWAKERGGIIIEDDFDSEFTVSTKNEDTVFSLEPHKTVIYINTFSKTIAPSVRVGYMVLPKELMNTFLSKIGFYSCTVPVFEQFVLAELLNSGDFERHINRIRRKRRKKRLEGEK